MIKKAIAIGAAGLMLLSVAGPAFGNGWWWGGGEVEIEDNWASVYNYVYTKADSGDNSIGGKYVFGGSIRTGTATAYTNLYNDINSSLVGCDGCGGDVEIEDNWASVGNTVYTKAYSGDNRIGGRCVGGGTITTGAAGATSIIDNIVNFSMIGMPTQ